MLPSSPFLEHCDSFQDFRLLPVELKSYHVGVWEIMLFLNYFLRMFTDQLKTCHKLLNWAEYFKDKMVLQTERAPVTALVLFSTNWAS